MEKKVRSKEELLKEKDSILKGYTGIYPRNKKPQLLTKKEKKALSIGKDEGRANLMYARISSRKVAIVLDLIRNKGLDEAFGIVNFTPKSASELLIKLLKSAEANAVNNNELNRDSLFVAEAYANQGPTQKRVMPRARGSTNRIKKRSSHITLVLKERK
ncbi:MAG: 50S ribosomal protein L22 [Clostridiales bacterium]|nr:50S ribosomal protein L22 [Clostridiales bacterium]